MASLSAGIGEMVHSSQIKSMNQFITDHGGKAFMEAVYHGAFAEVAFAYIHPCDEMERTENFRGIQKAFINAYV